ncbi:MAG TPA: hypothetical protein PLP17_16655 [Oligoflexia bacterium]|nr:hypothetical protein [Oligoflexia bacterium]
MSVRVHKESGASQLEYRSYYWYWVLASAFLPPLFGVLQALARAKAIFLSLIFQPVVVFSVLFGAALSSTAPSPERRIERVLGFVLCAATASLVLFLAGTFTVIPFVNDGNVVLLFSAKILASALLACAIGWSANKIFSAQLKRGVLLRLMLLGAAIDALIFSMYPSGQDAAMRVLSAANGFWYLPLALMLGWEIRRAELLKTRAQPSAAESFAIAQTKARSRKRMFIVLLFLPVLVIALVTLIDFLEYEGFCYGFTDGKWECPFFIYWRDSMFYLLLLWPLIFLWLAGLLLTVFSVRRDCARRQCDETNEKCLLN